MGPSVKNIRLRSADQVPLFARLRTQKRKTASLMVVAPGFGQHGGTRIMAAVCDSLTTLSDTLCLDFRGTGQSGGRYTFGAKEALDLQAAVDWAARRYRRVHGAGFSLGAYISLATAARFPKTLRRLLLVSCPTVFEEILTSGGPLLQAANLLTHAGALKLRLWAQGGPLFRWGNPLMKKIHGRDLAASCKVPAAFLVGRRDGLVRPRLSRAVFEAFAAGKTWTEMEGGFHAEYMAVMQRERFLAWVSKALR